MTKTLELLYNGKKDEGLKAAVEIGKVLKLKPFTFTINGSEYNSNDFTVYLPAVDRIKQHSEITCVTPDTIKGNATVDIGDLELDPDDYEKLFKVGDLIAVSDRGDSFIVHNRVVIA
ncbi:MAG: hypothetical protein GXZ11_05615 [Tissierellia bacterium]|nr:hypothetical protein [Tissierellia bacterium]